DNMPMDSKLHYKTSGDRATETTFDENSSFGCLIGGTQREKVRIEDQVKYLTYRLHALETILSDYVISSDMIQALTVDAKKMEEPKPYNHVTEENQINLLVN
ncbi:12588_t:CDS:2, partial [Entrophospora sp. SA101]